MATQSAPSLTGTKTLDTGNWIHGCFVVKLNSDFDTYKKVMEYAMQDETFGSTGKPVLDPAVKKVLDSTGSDTDPNVATPLYFSKAKCRDTSLGGNDAINPFPQFNEDDDISHPHFYSQTGTKIGMGQVYSEHIDDLQNILYLGFGIPLFSNVGEFWATATDADLAGFINKNEGITPEKIGYLIASTPVRIFNVATIPYRFIAAMVDQLTKVKISKYYSFSSQMPMYFRFTNTILVHLATNMSIFGSSTDVPSTSSNTSSTSAIALLSDGTKATDSLDGLPTVFKDYGLDMAKIMTKRFKYENAQDPKLSKRFTDDALLTNANKLSGKGVTADNNTNKTQSTSPNPNNTNSQTTQTDTSTPKSWTLQWIDAFAAAYGDGIYDGNLFIGFRIDKGLGGSETFSNSTGESQISQKANEAFGAGREARFDTMEGNIGSSGITGALTGIISGAADVLRGASKAFNLDPLAAAATGSARINIPEVWMSSSWSRSTSFSITCISPYGDFESIFQSLYVPFACILAGTLPRGTGFSSYSAPFVCQAYCRGIFSSPLCIIESLTVTRGADQFGMTTARLPLELSMNITLKDLSPVMYMDMAGDRGIVSEIFGSDTVFGEYLLTLSGMGLRERLSPFRSIRRKALILISSLRKNRLSPYNLGMETSRLFVSRLISSFISSGRNLPGN